MKQLSSAQTVLKAAKKSNLIRLFQYVIAEHHGFYRSQISDIYDQIKVLSHPDADDDH